MSDFFKSVIKIVIPIVLNLGIGALVAAIFFHWKKKDLLGGFKGGFIIALIGCIIGGFLLDKLLVNTLKIIIKILTFLSEDIGFNVIAGFIGAYFAVFIMNKLNHDKDRTKY